MNYRLISALVLLSLSVFFSLFVPSFFLQNWESEIEQNYCGMRLEWKRQVRASITSPLSVCLSVRLSLSLSLLANISHGPGNAVDVKTDVSLVGWCCVLVKAQ